MDIEVFLGIDRVITPKVKIVKMGIDISANEGKAEGTIILSHLVGYPDKVCHIFVVNHEDMSISVALYDAENSAAIPIPDGETRMSKDILELMMDVASKEDE